MQIGKNAVEANADRGINDDQWLMTTDASIASSRPPSHPSHSVLIEQITYVFFAVQNLTS